MSYIANLATLATIVLVGGFAVYLVGETAMNLFKGK